MHKKSLNSKIELNSNDLYGSFYSHDIKKYLKHAVLDTSNSFSLLSKSIPWIDEHIGKQLTSPHTLLLSQSDNVQKTSIDLQLLWDRVHIVGNHIIRIENGIICPFNDFKSKSYQLKHSQRAESPLNNNNNQNEIKQNQNQNENETE